MLKSAFSIRQILVGITAALAVMIAVLAGNEMVRDWVRLKDIEGLGQASLVSDKIFDAADRFSLERDIALSLLQAADSETIDTMRPRLEESRRGAVAALGATLAMLGRSGFAELPELRARMEASLPVIGGLRSQIDNALRLPLGRRNPELPALWLGATTALLSTMDKLWVGTVRDFANIDPLVTQHLRFKRFLHLIADYASRERSLTGRLIAYNVNPSPAEIAELQRGQGVLALSWDATRELADQSGIDTAIATYYSDANSHYSTMRDMTQNLFYAREDRSNVRYPISLELWFELSTQASESLVSLRDATIQATRDYMDRLTAGTERALLATGAMVFLALVLCVFCFWTIMQRVIGPINRIIDALLKAARGETVTFAAPAGGQDEIAKLAVVLQAFQKTMDQVKRTSAALNESRSHLAAVVDHALDGLITVDAEGTVKSFNPACERIFGYGADEMIGRNVNVLMPEPDRAGFDAYLSRHHLVDEAGGIGASGHEFTARANNGASAPIELLVSAFMLREVPHCLCVVRDIRRRKEAQKELIAYTQALERSNHELDEFAYIASHDLKEPLRGIHNHSRFLLEDNENRLDEEGVGRLKRLMHLSQRMERLVSDLLYFSRLGRQDLAVQSTDLNAAIHDVEGTLDVFLKERNARVLVPQPLPVVVCDSTRVTEVFRNLITNAVKYNDKKDIVVEIGCLGARQPIFYVKDNGKGINPEFHQDIFRMFKRLQASKDNEEGSGVGLTFVKKIVERHGGRIWLESEPGKGTIFYFTLEASRDDARTDSKAA